MAGSSQTIDVALGDRSYSIQIASGDLPAFPRCVDAWMEPRGIGKGGRRLAVIVTDEHVLPKHAAPCASLLEAASWKTETIALPAGEQTKSQQFVWQLYDRLVALQADRQTLVIAIGGGVIGDLAGFVAATYNRGLPFVQVPTTLLAQVDSSVGGKVGINHPQGKNLIGAFHQPIGVFLDTSFLATLPERDYCSGLAEVVKYGVILDASFFEFLERNVEKIHQRAEGVLREIVARSCRLKADVVEKDEFERTGLRAVLNYGHTFAHAYEALSGYGELLHGEAVAIGMISESQLAEHLGRIDPAVTKRQIDLLQSLGLPTALPVTNRPGNDAILAAMRLDKKNASGKLRFVLPTRIGQVELVTVAEGDVRNLLSDDAESTSAPGTPVT